MKIIKTISITNNNHQDVMEELEKAGWKKSKDKAAYDITNSDTKDVFLILDVDCSGEISRTVRINIRILFDNFISGG